MRIVKVHLKERSYPILIGNNLLAQAGKLIRQKTGLTHRCAVVLTVSPVRRLYGNTLKKSLQKARITPVFMKVPDTEKSKSISQYAKVLSRLTKLSKGGNTFFLITLGGGVVGDLGGFLAATFKRGIPLVHIPTTLLAQVDSSIGGKTGIDLPLAKNMAGSIWQPSAVISDVAVLKTLPPREFTAGMAEVIKCGVIKEEGLFRLLEASSPGQIQSGHRLLTRLVTICSRCKARFVEQDERDQKGERTFLNFGHTVGHAIESATEYSGRYRHGEAVSIGMVCATRISMALGFCQHSLLIRLIELLRKTGLPANLSSKVSAEAIFKHLLFDKKFLNSGNRFVLPAKVGKVMIREKVPEKIIREAIGACRL